MISPNGEIIYCNQQIIDHNGENLLWEENLDEGDSKHFIIVKNDLKLSVFGPFIESYGDIYPKISIMNPVYDSDKKLLGFVDLTYNLKKIWEITGEKSGLGETGEIYLVDFDRLLISKLKNNNYNVLTQSIESENTDRCFGMENITGHVGHTPVDIFLNYNGDKLSNINVNSKHLTYTKGDTALDLTGTNVNINYDSAFFEGDCPIGSLRVSVGVNSCYLTIKQTQSNHYDIEKEI